MTTTTNVRGSEKSQYLEARIAAGDRDAMAQYLSISRSQNLSKSEFDRRFYLVWDADHGNDTMILRNLAFLAAAAGNFELAHAFAYDFMLASFFSDAYHVALALRKFGSEAEDQKGREIISELARQGHILSQVKLRSENTADKGLIHKFIFQVFRIFKIMQAGVFSLKTRMIHELQLNNLRRLRTVT